MSIVTFYFSYNQYHSTSPYRCLKDLIFYMHDKHMETCKWMSWIVTLDLGRSYFAHMRWSSHERILISLVYKSVFILCVSAKAVFWFWLCGGIYKEKGNCWGTKNINSFSCIFIIVSFPSINPSANPPWRHSLNITNFSDRNWIKCLSDDQLVRY